MMLLIFFVKESGLEPVFFPMSCDNDFAFVRPNRVYTYRSGSTNIFVLGKPVD